jgi:hypothetical protein
MEKFSKNCNQHRNTTGIASFTNPILTPYPKSIHQSRSTKCSNLSYIDDIAIIARSKSIAVNNAILKGTAEKLIEERCWNMTTLIR